MICSHHLVIAILFFSNVKHTWQEGGGSTPGGTADSFLKDVFVVLSITGAPGGPGASPVAHV